jgi:Domain of unknown function (DUF5615)
LAHLHSDEDFPGPTVEELRRLGHDVVTAAEVGRAGLGIPDDDVLAFAHAAGRAVLTHNRTDFRHLHGAGHPHSGVLICTRDGDFAALAARIDTAIAVEGELAGKLVRVVRPPA